jgi:hypothetical protein
MLSRRKCVLLLLCVIIASMSCNFAFQQAWQSKTGQPSWISGDGYNIYLSTYDKFVQLSPAGATGFMQQYSINNGGKAFKIDKSIFLATSNDVVALNKDGSVKWISQHPLGSGQTPKYLFICGNRLLVSNDNLVTILDVADGVRGIGVYQANTTCEPYISNGYYYTGTSRGVQSYKSFMIPDLKGNVTVTPYCLDVNIINQGLSDVNSTMVKFLVKKNDGSLRIIHYNAGTLPAGSSKNFKLTGEYSRGYLILDPYNSVYELNEKNNQYYFPQAPNNGTNSTNGTTQPPVTDPTVWLNGWTWKVPWTISYNGTQDLQDYTLQDITVNYDSSKMRSDFGDVRFTLSDNKTILNYTMVNKTDSVKAVFDVKVPVIKNQSSMSLTMFTGNSGASTTSNPNSTYELYDDMSDVSGWTQLSGTWYNEGGYISGDGTYPSPRMKRTFNDVGGKCYQYRIKAPFSGFYPWAGLMFKSPSYDMEAYGSPSDTGYVPIIFTSDDGYEGGNSIKIFKVTNTSLEELSSQPYTFNTSDWYDCKITIDETGLISVYINGEFVTSATDTSFTTGETVRFHNNNNAIVHCFDELKICKYTSNPPKFQIGFWLQKK